MRPDASDDWTRREVLKTLGLGAVATSLPGCSRFLISRREGDFDPGVASPIDRTLLGDRAPARFSGDDPSAAHHVLRTSARSASASKESHEKAPLVIIGGGIAGLTSAYLLREHQPILLEAAERFGGNSRGEAWRGLDYAIGAAYFMEPEKGSPIERILTEIGANKAWRARVAEDPILFQGKPRSAFWNGETDPSHPAQFRKLRVYFEDTLHNRNGLEFPEIPIPDPEIRKLVEGLDGESFYDHLSRIAGERLHPHIETAIEHFCWSSFGASSTEISAAAGLNFYAAEFGKILVMPGGNAAVAERLFAKISETVPRKNLRARSIATEVRCEGDRVLVTYIDGHGNTRAIEAAHAILACPKFVVSRILKDMETDRAAAFSRLDYHPYLVANILLRKSIPPKFYDMFLIGKGDSQASDFVQASKKQQVTDVVHACFANPSPSRSILTLYRGIPYPEGRGEFLAPGAYDSFRADFSRQITGEILPILGADEKDVVDLRISRWGHALPRPAVGMIRDGTIEKMRRPFRDRVFFVEQDNWMLPAFETAVSEALYWARNIQALLTG